MNSGTIALILNVIAVVGVVLWKIFLGGKEIGIVQRDLEELNRTVVSHGQEIGKIREAFAAHVARTINGTSYPEKEN